ncbi:helix-turn-helix transcriptional regulator [Paenibacillus humicola]|uniref:helix-turn-helix transcriptional regulator n=1 Tax=Paenibacillus humicola TaxID=3110540 RepID=UPI00237B5E64|nr:helix-turn-helix transcriptional regulator [Paenibacillus humicola]
MPDTHRLEALGAFLRSKRASIKPQSVGLPAGARRRTPGLRREEIAQLAGVSATWYTWLEQGRDINVSAQVLDAIAGALRLTKDERDYMAALALGNGQGIGADPAAAEDGPEIAPSLRRVLRELRSCPTILSDRRCHIVGWNRAAAHVFVDFDRIPFAERNLIRLLFTRKELRSLAVNWEHFVEGFLAIFRTYYGQYVGDEWYDRFIREMSGLHPEFQTLWQRSRVSRAPEVTVEFRHSRAGKMLFELTSFQVHGSTDLRCSVYSPVEGSGTESKLIRLMEPDGDSEKMQPARESEMNFTPGH